MVDQQTSDVDTETAPDVCDHRIGDLLWDTLTCNRQKAARKAGSWSYHDLARSMIKKSICLRVIDWYVNFTLLVAVLLVFLLSWPTMIHMADNLRVMVGRPTAAETCALYDVPPLVPVLPLIQPHSDAFIVKHAHVISVCARRFLLDIPYDFYYAHELNKIFGPLAPNDYAMFGDGHTFETYLEECFQKEVAADNSGASPPKNPCAVIWSWKQTRENIGTLLWIILFWNLKTTTAFILLASMACVFELLLVFLARRSLRMAN